MLEMLAKVKKVEKRPWQMFFLGIFYATIAFLFVALIFGADDVLKEGSGILLVTFTVVCCMPFVYSVIKYEEQKDVVITNSGRLVKEHSKAIQIFLWLFLGFLVAFSFWYTVIPESSGDYFNFQIRTFCAINNPNNYNLCVANNGTTVTGAATKIGSFLSIFSNNIGVLIFTIIFSLAFGAGAIFILVWNASVISAAIGVFANGSLIHLPMGFLKYMIHGIPEIAAYFIGALAGGIISVAIMRKDLDGERKWPILEDALILLIIAIVVLLVSALIEVFFSHVVF